MIDEKAMTTPMIPKLKLTVRAPTPSITASVAPSITASVAPSMTSTSAPPNVTPFANDPMEQESPQTPMTASMLAAERAFEAITSPKLMEQPILFRCYDATLRSLLQNALQQGFQQVSSWLRMTFTGEKSALIEYQTPDRHWHRIEAQLWDFPTLVECHKSVDKFAQCTKSGTLSKIWIVGEMPESVRKRVTKEYQFPDGLAAPLKQVRQRRFRKRAEVQNVTQVEEQVKQLLAKDREASYTSYVVRECREDGELIRERREEEDEADLVAELERELMAEMSELVSDEDEELDEETDTAHTPAPTLPLDPKQERIQELTDKMHDLQNRIELKTLQRVQTKNPILQARFENDLKMLREEVEAVLKEQESLEM